MIASDPINPERTPRLGVSGGQTGVNRAGLDWAIYHGIEHVGWCPAGRNILTQGECIAPEQGIE